MTVLTSFIKKIRKYRFFNTVIVALGLVLVWRGTWGIFDLIFPTGDLKWYLFTIVIGLFLLWADDFSLDELRRE